MSFLHCSVKYSRDNPAAAWNWEDRPSSTMFFATLAAMCTETARMSSSGGKQQPCRNRSGDTYQTHHHMNILLAVAQTNIYTLTTYKKIQRSFWHRYTIVGVQ